MAKKIKEVKSHEKLSLENIKVGDKILDLHDEEVEITDDLIEQMRQYEQETNKYILIILSILKIYLPISGNFM